MSDGQETGADPLAGASLMARLERLAGFSEDAKVLTRTLLSPAHRAAAAQLLEWMTEAGMQAHIDAIGNVVGRYEAVTPGQPALLIGSHYDTVRDAGRYDGAFGIIGAIACVDALNRGAERLPFAVEVIGFADEEGVRFGATLLGSRAVAGTFDAAALDALDADDRSLEAALRAAGHDPAQIGACARNPAQVLGYVEMHIEQGPVLLSESLPVGVVTSIAGASRFILDVEGLSGHAGTVPMNLRRDAAVAAAEALLAVERRCAASGSASGLVGTVGQLEVPNGATNVIPGHARFSLDVRAGDDAARRTAVTDILGEFDAIAGRREVRIHVAPIHEAPAAVCSQPLMTQLDAAIARAGLPVRRLPSGAGHDAMAFSGLTDIAMLFVRCGNGGISHHPDEILDPDDAETASRILLDFMRAFQAHR